MVGISAPCDTSKGYFPEECFGMHFVKSKASKKCKEWTSLISQKHSDRLETCTIVIKHLVKQILHDVGPLKCGLIKMAYLGT